MDILTLDLPGIRKIASGKVREIFDLGEHLLLVATDRISAFDCILPNPDFAESQEELMEKYSSLHG